VFEATARHYARQEIAKYEAAYPENGPAQEYTPIISSLREFDPREDTYAQWIMAAFSVVATLASIFAVVLLNDTLAATRDAVRAADDAVKVTRDLGQAQVRAYIDINDVSYRISRDMLIVRGRLCNIGQSPAFNFDASPKAGVNTAFFDASWSEVPHLVAKEESFTFKWSSIRLPSDDLAHIFEGGTFWSAHCTFTWLDVFQKSNRARVSMWATDGLSEADSDGFKTGKMRVAYASAENGKEAPKE